jgi:hypothetical protein
MPPFLVVAAPEDHPLTPDDLILQPAWTKEQIEALWDEHDGRSFGSMVVGVYKLEPENEYYVRDTSWGMMGRPGETGRADSEKEEHQL